MTRTCTIALFTCILAAGATTARAAQQTPPQLPASQLPDEWKMKREKEAEQRKRAEEQKKADAEKKAEADKEKKAAADKKAEAAKTEAAKKAQADAAKKADADAAKKAAAAKSADAAQKAEAAKTDAAKKAEADKKAAAAREAETKKAAGQKQVDDKMPPPVVPADQQPDAWKMQKEKDRDKKPTPEPVKAGDPRPESWRTEKERAREKGAGATGTATTDAQKRAAAAKPKQPWHGWSDRAIVSLNGGWQSSSFELHDTRNFDPSVPGDRERRTIAADYAVEPGVAFDLSGVVRAWKGLGVGVSVTRFEDSRDVPVSGTVPHPFFFNRARDVSGTTTGAREELAVHLDAVWVVPVNRKLQIALFGGPTFYSVKQTVVSDFSFSESYPYDTATLTSVRAEDESTSVTGFNAGADVGYYFTHTIGVGGVIRFGRGTVDTSLGSLDVGGPEFGVGLRLRIPQGRTTARPTTPRPPKTTPPPPPRRK